MEKVRIGVIGLGNRGYGMLKGELLRMPDVEVTAVCDIYPDRCERAVSAVREASGREPFSTTDYRCLLEKGCCDAVYNATSWEYHAEISIAAMRAGVAVGLEVGGAYSLEECFGLVEAYESTGTPFMFLENCCFDKSELLVTAMVRAGKLGTIVHCSGAYAHDLRDEVSGGNVNRHYRLRNYINRSCENYPTHELGPIARLLNINRGNRMLSLVSVASKAAGMEEYIKEKNPDASLAGVRFRQGDIVTTVISCAGGETITLRLDTTLPRYYNREFTVRGTKGMYEQSADMFFLDGMREGFDPVAIMRENMGNSKAYEAEFLPRIWREITEEQKKGGHGGMDSLELRAFVDALKEGKPMPIDVYDAASWMCVTALSERSIALGGMPQSIPDFTNGKWLVRKPEDVTEL